MPEPNDTAKRPAGDEFAGLLSAIGATEAIRPLAEATASVFTDARQLEKVLQDYANTGTGQLQGRALEFLEVLKFNRAAAEAGSSLRASATHLSDPAAAADVLIRDGQDVLKEVQAKSYGRAADAVRALADPKYEGMERLVPKDQVGRVQEVIERHQSRFGDISPNTPAYREVDDKLTGQLQADGIASGGTSRAEAEFAAQHPELVALQHRGMAALKEIGSAAVAGSAIGGSLQGVFTGLHQSVRLSRNETTATYCGMAGQMLITIPVVGAAVGAITGYVAAAVLVESGVLGVGVNNIVAVAEERRRVVEQECAAAILQMHRCQQELDALKDEYRQGFRQTFAPLLEQIAAHQQAGGYDGSFSRLVQMGDALGRSLPWRTLEEFDVFMHNHKVELIL